jgi:hypothetical protein
MTPPPSQYKAQQHKTHSISTPTPSIRLLSPNRTPPAEIPPKFPLSSPIDSSAAPVNPSQALPPPSPASRSPLRPSSPRSAPRGTKTLAPPPDPDPTRREPAVPREMEAAAARKEWRAVPDAPLRTNGAEVVSPPPSARKNPTFISPRRHPSLLPVLTPRLCCLFWCFRTPRSA